MRPRSSPDRQECYQLNRIEDGAFPRIVTWLSTASQTMPHSMILLVCQSAGSCCEHGPYRINYRSMVVEEKCLYCGRSDKLLSPVTRYATMYGDLQERSNPQEPCLSGMRHRDWRM